MSRVGRRSTSLATWKPVRASIHSRVCNSAPTQSIPNHDQDWDRKLLQDASIGVECLRACSSDDTWAGHLVESKNEAGSGGAGDTKSEIGLEAVNDAPQTGNAGDFTDFLDPSTPTSEIKALGNSGSDEPYEYWGKAWSYSRSPFSNCSSLSFEDSDSEEVAASDSMYISLRSEVDSSAREESPLTVQAQISTPKLSRFSDLSPRVVSGWTASVLGAECFKGPTSI